MPACIGKDSILVSRLPWAAEPKVFFPYWGLLWDHGIPTPRGDPGQLQGGALPRRAVT